MEQIPFDDLFVDQLNFVDTKPEYKGGVFHGSFDLEVVGDTYLEFAGYSKGTVWVNGRNIGRYWNVGPQMRLFCPGVWLIQGTNEVIIVDMDESSPSDIGGFPTVK